MQCLAPPGTNPAQIIVTLTPPRRIIPDPSLTVGPGAARQNTTLARKIVGQLGIGKYRAKRFRVTIILAPTEPKALPPPHAALPAGPWTITLNRPNTPMTGSIEARIQIAAIGSFGGPLLPLHQVGGRGLLRHRPASIPQARR